jgi:hypothetical protein
LHPLATIVAKTKLLVLPVYPAAWPQAKKHPIVQVVFKSYNDLRSLHLVKKIGFRYRQAGSTSPGSKFYSDPQNVDCHNRSSSTYYCQSGLDGRLTRFRGSAGAVNRALSPAEQMIPPPGNGISANDFSDLHNYLRHTLGLIPVKYVVRTRI